MNINYTSTYIKNISTNESKILQNKISELIEKKFIKLNYNDKKILINYLNKTVLLFSYYYYNDNFLKQMFQNDSQDIFSILILLLPYYELNNSKDIESLDELFLNSNSKAKSLSSSYYIDHLYLKTEPEYLKKYFLTSINQIYNTLRSINCMIYPNWLNIFPYTMENYKESEQYINFTQIKNKDKITIFKQDSLELYTNLELQKSENNFLLDYPILYSTIYNFLYNDIKSIKWLIYDIVLNDKDILVPNIIYLSENLHISNISSKPWEKLTQLEKDNLTKKWVLFYESDKTNQVSLKSLILFYLRWEKDNENLKDLKISQKCLDKIKINIKSIVEENNSSKNEEIDDKNEIEISQSKEIEQCLKEIYPIILYEKLYSYIFDCIQKFKYTWYGFVCLSDNKNILNANDYFTKYYVLFEKINFTDKENLKNKNYITPKNFYNFFKLLIHTQDNKFKLLSNDGNWFSLSLESKSYFINKFIINTKYEWFKITGNLRRTYEINNEQDILVIQNSIRQILLNTNYVIDIIFQTLVYNGMFSYYKFNPVLTDNTLIPDKNKDFPLWAKYIKDNVDINPYDKSYHAFSNTMLKTHGEDSIKSIKNSNWFTNFGANWIAQIQLYHHYINNRVMFITGATGAGKSTVAPFLLVYAVKIYKYNNNARVVCTQPRTQPTKDNAETISKNIGLPMTIKYNNDLDETNESYKKTTVGEAIQKDINYIQYKHKKGTLLDDLYHPCLCLYTDGSLYNIIKQSYFFKKQNKNFNKNSELTFLSSNTFDIILVDEAHEHNPNMDMILTLSKFACYINNQITLGIISATMDDDEIIYRKYFEPIDDNWKSPLNIQNSYFIKDKYINLNNIDRRIHLSVPFGGMNFEVKEYPNKESSFPESVETFSDIKKINEKVILILKHILSTTKQGDILIFQAGESDIKALVKKINSITEPNVIAIPFYSSLKTEILENIVKKIDKTEVRNNKFRYPKNKYEITEIDNIPEQDLLPAGTYNRFIILATNIAEASITIDTLEYVIDIGNQKINIFNPETNTTELKTVAISIPNQKQRKGRVGRKKPGSVYYTYDRFALSEKVIYKINIQDITSTVIDLITESANYLFDEQSDPYKTSELNYIPESIRKQYVYFDDNLDDTLFSDDVFKRDASNIIYPYSDGKYKLETLIDEDGKFYIIHPNEDYWIRNPENLQITSKSLKPNYSNKVIKVIEYAKIMGIIGNNNLLTKYGELINNISDFIDEIGENSIELIRIILDCESFNIAKDSELYKNIILFLVFKTTEFNIKLSNYLVGKADYLIYSSIIDSSFFNKITLNQIINKFNDTLSNYIQVIEEAVEKLLSDNKFLLSTIMTTSSNKFKTISYEDIKKLLIKYYIVKIKIDLINANTDFVLKKEFESTYEYLIKNKDSFGLYSNLFNKIIYYYENSDINFLKRNVIKEFLKFLNYENNDNINKNNDNINKNKFIENVSSKIQKSLNTAIYKQEFLKKIDINNNLKYSYDINIEYDKLSDYDKLCFLIIKNIPNNVLIKISDTEFYINYYKMDINNIYFLEKTGSKYTTSKVPRNMRNYLIFAMSINDKQELDNIMVLSENVILFLDRYLKSINLNLKSKNISWDKDLSETKYSEENMLLINKKIDKIIQYINKH
jgi:hypothetical protein